MLGLSKKEKKNKHKKPSGNPFDELEQIAGENIFLYKCTATLFIVGLIFLAFNFATGGHSALWITSMILFIIAFLIFATLLFFQVKKNKKKDVYKDGINNPEFYHHIGEAKKEQEALKRLMTENEKQQAGIFSQAKPLPDQPTVPPKSNDIKKD
ncbi:MAG: hypothetical protein LBV22_02545 [Mycoplasmataceae bacterium]|jgi:hypothetical protein|nr:hypothetical protein [Mycoplasmataceae bacterium]